METQAKTLTILQDRTNETELFTSTTEPSFSSTTTNIPSYTSLSPASSSSTASFLLKTIRSTIQTTISTPSPSPSPSPSLQPSLSSSSLAPNNYFNGNEQRSSKNNKIEMEALLPELNTSNNNNYNQFFDSNDSNIPNFYPSNSSNDNNNSTAFMTMNNPLAVTFTGVDTSFINGHDYSNSIGGGISSSINNINNGLGLGSGPHQTAGDYFNSFHSEDQLSDLFPDIPIEVTQFATFCCVLFMIVGIPGNLLTIIALARCKKVRNATAYFIINLSVCDLLFCCFNLPMAVSVFWYRNWIHGKTMCTLFPFARYGLMAVSIFSVLAITLNRYVMIGHPRLYPKIYGNRELIIQIILIWLGSFGAVIPTLFEIWGRFDLDHEIGSCSIVRDSNNRSPKSFLFLLAFVMPCLAIIICYAKIFMIVRKATIKSHQPNLELNAQNGRMIRTTDEQEIIIGSSSSPLKSSLKENNSNNRSNSKRSSNNKSSTKNKTSSVKGSTTKQQQQQHSITSGTTTKSGINSPTSPEHEILKRPSSIGSSNSNSSSSGIGIGGIGPDGNRRGGRNIKGSRKKSGLALLGRPSIAVIHQRGKMTSKDRKLLYMILVIFLSFVICYLPITIVKALTKQNNSIWNIIGYILIYMTTCMNPIIYVAMSLEYRQAYKSLLFCTNENSNSRTNQSGSWQAASKRHSNLRSPSTNSDFFSTGSSAANKRKSGQL